MRDYTTINKPRCLAQSGWAKKFVRLPVDHLFILCSACVPEIQPNFDTTIRDEFLSGPKPCLALAWLRVGHIGHNQ